MFLTIISDEYTAVKEKVKKQRENNEQDMIIDRFRYMVGKFKHRVVNVLGGKNPKTKRRLSRIFGIEKARLMKLKEKEGRDLVRKRSKLLLQVRENNTTETKEAISLDINKYAVLPTEALKNAGAEAKVGGKSLKLPPIVETQASPTIKRLNHVIDENEAMGSKLRNLISSTEEKLDRLRLDREGVYLNIWDDIKACIALPENPDFQMSVEYEDPSTLLADTLEFIENKVVNAISASRSRLVELTEVEKKISLHHFNSIRRAVVESSSSIGESGNLIYSMKYRNVDQQDEDCEDVHIVKDVVDEL